MITVARPALQRSHISTQTPLELLKTYFGYDAFRPLQADIIEHVLGGNDALVLMPTGGGKSLCYQLPALHMSGLTLVISPLIALMKDQVDSLTANGIPAAFLNSSLTATEMRKVMKQIGSGELKLLYVAPERLATPGFAEFLQTLDVSLLAIDEAHCISEWGHDFRPDYRNLASLRTLFPGIPILALTATATERVRDDIASQLHIGAEHRFVSSFNRSNLMYRVIPKQKGVGPLTEMLAKYPGKASIIYCFSRKDCESTASALSRAGISALPYHAGLTGEIRKGNQEKFIRDEVQVMVATIAFGMGIDKPDIRLVVHADLPKTLEGYYQETGRAGRDGLPSECVMMYSYGDKMKHDFFIRQMANPEEQANARNKLATMLEYASMARCRRRFLLDYFDETAPVECGNCDICLEPREEFEGARLAQKILSAIVRTGERFGGGYVANVLIGKSDAKMIERGHSTLSVFGIVDDFSQAELQEVMLSLVAMGFLCRSTGEYPTLSLTRSGGELMGNRNATLMLSKPRVRPAKKTKAARLPRTTKLGSTAQIDYDEVLFSQLRVLRKRLADERGVPPFIIFGDVSLQQMAHFKPESARAFAEISGVGQEKLARFGEIFTEAIQNYMADKS